MSNVIPEQNKETFNIQNHFWIKNVLKIGWIFWPMLAVYFVIPKLFLLLDYFFNKNIALYFYYLSDLIILGTTVFAHRFKWGKSFTILLAVCLCVKEIFLAIQYLIQKFIYYPEFLGGILYTHSLYVLIKIVLIFSSLKAIRYLWNNCHYNEIFAFRKIKFIQKTSHSCVVRFITKFVYIMKEINRNVNFKIVKEIWRYRRWIFSLWFIPVVYAFWFKQYFFLYPNSNLMQFFNYLKIMSIPLGVTFIALFLYKPCKLMNRFGIILTAITHVGTQLYGIIQYFIYYYHSSIFRYNKDLLIMFKRVRYFLLNPASWIVILDLFYLSIGVLIAIRLCVSYLKGESKIKLSKNSKKYGTAKFLDLKGVYRLNDKNGLPIGATPKIADFSDTEKLIQNIKKYGGNELIRIKSDHTTLVAPSRTGKGAGIIIPTLLEYPGPVFVTDVKGENYVVTKRAREAKGRKIIAFDPFCLTNSPKIKINPLKFLNPNSLDIVDDSQSLASLICPVNPNDSGNAQHFQEKAAAIIQCLLLYVTCCKNLDDSKRTLSTIYDILCLEQNKLLNFFSTTIAQDTSLANGTAARLANTIVGTAPEERSGALSSAQVVMRFVDTPHIREATNGSDVLLSDITQGEIDLFVCIPLEKLPVQYRLLRLITGITFIEMQKARGKIGIYNLLMLLDEMPALGHIKAIEEMLVYGGGFGISLLAVTQTIEFLQSVYPNTWKTFFSNQLSIFFGCSEPMTTKFVAEKLDKKTIEISSINQSTGRQTRYMELLGTSSNQTSNSISETGRELLTPGEIEKLGNRVVLAFNRGEDPIICHRIDYRERSEWKGLWDENPLYANRGLHNSYTIKEYFKKVITIIMS